MDPSAPARGTPRPRARWQAAGGLAALLALVLATLLSAGGPAHALTAIAIDPDKDRIELTTLGEFYDGRGDNLQVETAPGPDGVAGRMSVRAVTGGTNPSWIVVALSNPTDRAVERWLTAERYTLVGSGIVWPDLDARRLEAITPSIGFVPERIKSDRADIFRITLEPRQTITYVVELSSDRFARLYLWKPIEYEIKARDRLLFNGTLLGLVGLLAIFLTAVFAANHKAIFPMAALVAWCVLAHLCVDFGFWHKLFQLRPEDNAIYRAATEAAVAASLVMFLHTFLRLGLWHGVIRMLVSAWVIGQLALIAVAVIDPRLAATFARASFALIGALGGVFTLFLAAQGQDRALSLIPTWLLFLVWIFAAAVTLTGRLAGDVVVSGLIAGLVLIVILIGFTVTQFAFRQGIETTFGSTPSELQTRALAIDGAAAAVWEWTARRDEIKLGPVVEAALGLNPGDLSCKVDDFVQHVHPADRERFRLVLWSVQERNGGSFETEFRMRHADSSYRWFELQASSVPGAEPRSLKCVGLMRDVTDSKRAVERLMHDAVHDSLTGLPNRELFLDRLGIAMERAKSETTVRPTVIFLDIDKFKSANSTYGLVVGDSLLLTIARRLQRHLGPQDTLARVGGDQFAILMLTMQDPRELAALAERLRRSLRSPIRIANQDVVLTGSLGIAVYDGTEEDKHDLLKEAEIAMYRAKRGGTDRIEIFNSEMRGDRDERVAIESDLRKAIDKGQLRVLYQPIIALATEELAGFEALVRWQHPKHGLMSPGAFIPVAEESDLIVKLGSFVLTRAVQDAARWQKELPRPDAPLFVSVNVSSRQLFRQDLVQEIRHILGRAIVPKGALKLEITETLVMENPEQATEILGWLRAAGADLALDDFGTGYSSLAYLNRFPFDTIKIDRALVHGASAGGEGGVIVRSIVALAHELGKKVVAEGVETAEDVGLLRSLGCEYAQGFYYGGVLGEREVLQLLRNVRKSERRLQRRGFFRPLGSRSAEPKTEPAPSSEPGAAGAQAPSAASEAPPAPPTSGQSPAAGGTANGAAAPTGGPAPSPSAPQSEPRTAPVRAKREAQGFRFRIGKPAEPKRQPKPSATAGKGSAAGTSGATQPPTGAPRKPAGSPPRQAPTPTASPPAPSAERLQPPGAAATPPFQPVSQPPPRMSPAGASAPPQPQQPQPQWQPPASHVPPAPQNPAPPSPPSAGPQPSGAFAGGPQAPPRPMPQAPSAGMPPPGPPAAPGHPMPPRSAMAPLAPAPPPAAETAGSAIETLAAALSAAAALGPGPTPDRTSSAARPAEPYRQTQPSQPAEPPAWQQPSQPPETAAQTPSSAGGFVPQPASPSPFTTMPPPSVAPAAPAVDFSTLPPSIAASLARLAGVPMPDAPAAAPQPAETPPEPGTAPAQPGRVRIAKAGE